MTIWFEVMWTERVGVSVLESKKNQSNNKTQYYEFRCYDVLQILYKWNNDCTVPSYQIKTALFVIPTSLSWAFWLLGGHRNYSKNFVCTES